MEELQRVLLKKKKQGANSASSTPTRPSQSSVNHTDNPPFLETQFLEPYQDFESSFGDFQVGEMPTMPELPEQAETIVLDKAEKEIIRLLVTHVGAWLDETTKLETYLLAELEEVEFRTPLFARLIAETKIHVSETFFNRDFFISHEDAEIRQFSADVLSSIAETSPNWEKFSIFIPKKDEDLAIVAYDAVLRLKQKRLQELIAEAKKGLSSENLEEQENALKMLMALKAEEQKIDKEKGTVVKKA
jgi:DNA primase